MNLYLLCASKNGVFCRVNWQVYVFLSLTFFIFPFSFFTLKAQRVVINFNNNLKTAPNLTAAPLKYDKDFAYSFTFDDASEDPYTCALQIFKGGFVKGSGTTYSGLYYTDGCGNALPFRAGLAWNTSNRSNQDLHTGSVPAQMTWAQLNELLDNNWDVFNHSYAHLALAEGYLSPSDYIAQISLNEDAIQNHTKNSVRPPFFVVPSGDVNYYQYAFGQGYKGVFNQNGNDQGLLGINVDNDVDFSKTIFRGNLDETLFTSFLDNLVAKSSAQNHLWYNEFCHRIDNFSGGGLNFYSYLNYMQNVAQKYGAQGADKMWMAPLQEVAEYLTTKKALKFSAQVSGNKLILDFDVSQIPSWVKRQAITFKFDGTENIQSIEFPNGGSGTFNNGGKRIINIDLNGITAPVYNCPSLKKNIGDACDDGNSNTTNDKIQSDCSCKGTAVNTSGLTIQCPSDITVNVTNGASTQLKWQEPTVTTTCPDNSGTSTCVPLTLVGYQYLGALNNKQYFVSYQTGSSAAASALAKSVGAQLVTISSKAENDFIVSLLKPNTVAFIGAIKDGAGNWVNGNGATLAYTNWENGFPNASNNTQTVGVLATWAQGRWLTVSPLAEYPNVIELACTNSSSKIAPTQISGPSNNTNAAVGNYSVVYSATDKCGNAGSCKFNVSVTDKTISSNALTVQLTTNVPNYSINTPVMAQVVLNNTSNTDYANIKLQFPYPSGVVTGSTVQPILGNWSEYCFGNTKCYLWSIPTLKANSQAALTLPLFMVGSDAQVLFSANILEITPSISPLPSASLSLPLSANSNQLTAISLREKLTTDSSKLIAIYPNPTDESVNLEIKSTKNQPMNLQFYDLNGKIMLQQQLNLKVGINTFEFDVSDWYTGTYFIYGGRNYSGGFFKS